ncbi:MAG: divalent metal cation transporter [Pyrinomonadaceae bacterium]
MLGVPVLAGAAIYAIADARACRGRLVDKRPLSIKFYAVVAAAMLIGLALNFAGVNAVKMLFWAAVLNGLLAPALVALVVLSTNNKKIMGDSTNSPVLKWLGWITAVVMSPAALARFVVS